MVKENIANVRQSDSLVKGMGCTIGDNLQIKGDGQIVLGNNVIVGKNVTINVKEKLLIGDRSLIGDNFAIEGREIEIGTEFWSGYNCVIGGGSCFEKTSRLKIGYWAHLGNYGMINTARPVTIGDEVGMGIETKIYTHGAYLSVIEGFPVEFGPITIGSHVWLPYAIVLPNVNIGDYVVVGAGAMVAKDLPTGCLAVGTPAKAIKENCYPRKYSKQERKQIVEGLLKHFVKDIENATVSYREVDDEIWLLNEKGDWVRFSLTERQVLGEPTALSERLRNELRRYGVRFKSYPEGNEYKQWK
jgi:acetyltransferase-like isoleucine patch superfamily enzyme